jgi:hypothetical protein
VKLAGERLDLEGLLEPSGIPGWSGHTGLVFMEAVQKVGEDDESEEGST